MVDKASEQFSLHTAWRALGQRLAVAAGAVTALASLFESAPAWVASLRGALCFFIVRTVWKWGLVALEAAMQSDHKARATKQAEEETVQVK